MADVFTYNVNDDVCPYPHMVDLSRGIVPLEPHSEFCHFKRHLL
jgi:hypothetical protein